MCDIRFEDHGSIFLAHPETDEGLDWLIENVDAPGYAHLGRALAVERRYVGDIADGAMRDGLECEFTS